MGFYVFGVNSCTCTGCLGKMAFFRGIFGKMQRAEGKNFVKILIRGIKIFAKKVPRVRHLDFSKIFRKMRRVGVIFRARSRPAFIFFIFPFSPFPLTFPFPIFIYFIYL